MPAEISTTDPRNEPIVAEMDSRGWAYVGPAWDPWTKRFCGQFVRRPDQEAESNG